jgi:hypothetical protein
MQNRDESIYYRPTTYEITKELLVHAMWFIAAMSLMALFVAYVPRDTPEPTPCGEIEK